MHSGPLGPDTWREAAPPSGIHAATRHLNGVSAESLCLSELIEGDRGMLNGAQLIDVSVCTGEAYCLRVGDALSKQRRCGKCMSRS